MLYNLDYLIAALFFLLVILFHFVKRRKLDDLNNRIFRFFILLGITDIVFDIATSVLISDSNPEYTGLTSFMLTIFYLLQAIVPYALFLYARVLCKDPEKNDSVVFYILSFPAFLMGILVLLNCWFGFLFRIDPQGHYVRGLLYPAMYLYAGLYGIVVMIYSFANYRRLGFRNIGTLCEFVFIMGICVLVQGFWNATLTTGLGLGLGIMVLYLTINNPSDYTDRLTDDFNIQTFLGWIRELYRQKKNFHILSINIHNLKQLNKLFGVRFGDDFLCSISLRLKEILRSPYVFRVSSKRFVLITYSLSEYERVRKEVDDFFHSSLSLREEQIQLCGIICGVVDAGKLKDSDTLLSLLDYLASLAPLSSETLLIQCDENIMERFLYNKEIERFLRTAIEEDLFEVYYQPVFSLKKNGFVSLEALSRLRHPIFGSIPPDVFISIAETSGQIASIGQLQLRRICSFVSEHRELMEKIEHININLSPAELLRDGYSRQITEIINEYQLPFSFFQIEITETVATEYSEKLYQLTADFKECGIRLSLDDFGSGYANLNTVLRLPFSCIKLDRSLLNEIQNDSNTRLFYQNIVTALQSMGYDVISEGVEHKNEVTLLESFGVDMIQGFYFSKPLDSDSLINLLL